MNSQLLSWLKENEGRSFVSPRNNVFGTDPQGFTIRYVDEENKLVRISFSRGNTQALPLYFWMFERTLEYLSESPETTYPIGARVQPPYPKESIEGEIWKEPKPYPSNYKSSSHVLDILALAGFIEYAFTRDRDTRRKVQGARYSRNGNPPKPPDPPTSPTDSKEVYLKKYRDIIKNWAEENAKSIYESRLEYHWRNKTRKECEQLRNEVAKSITLSRIRNQGAIDLETLDKIIKWGFGMRYPDRDPQKALEITRRAFNYLDEGKIQKAAFTLLNVKGLGISRVTKIIGLSDQENLCIYDSRVGYALRTLTVDGERLHLIPVSRTGRLCDNAVSNERWAREYEKVLWTLEVIRDYMNERCCTYRKADLEMALFMMGN